MNDNVQKWLEALRSGDYAQTKGTLNRTKASKEREDHPAGFCCLGVACDLYQKEVGDLEIALDNDTVIYNDTDSHLPKPVKKWLGLNDSIGTFMEYTPVEMGEDNRMLATSLAHANDSGVNFNHIADLIESKPKGLFSE